MNTNETTEVRVMNEEEVNLVSGAGPFFGVLSWLAGKVKETTSFTMPVEKYPVKPITGGADWGTFIRPWKWF